MKLSVLKLGGELLETQAKLMAAARAVVKARRTVPLVVVHGGGKEIDVQLQKAGLTRRQVDGLRITDSDTLDVVVSVLAGLINTRFVAAVNAAGGKAVGLTGADAGVAPVKPAAPHRSTSGELVDLGLVGEPMRTGSPAVLTALAARGFVPIVASVSAAKSGQLYNVNADTLAANVAARLEARRLVFAGGTAGVLDEQGHTIPTLAPDDIAALVRSGTASAGMIAKLTAGQAAAQRGVADVSIVDGRVLTGLAAALASRTPAAVSLQGTRITS